jgi:hypothetical protein
MNPYLIGFASGTLVGLWYERDLSKAVNRATITTIVARAANTPPGRAAITQSLIFTGTAIQETGMVAIKTASLIGGTKTASVIGRAGTFALAAGAGAVIGAATGTAISSVAFGQEGKQMAIQFYTGQSGAKWYEYIPHYNYGRIVKHYITEAIV